MKRAIFLALCFLRVLWWLFRDEDEPLPVDDLVARLRVEGLV